MSAGECFWFGLASTVGAAYCFFIGGIGIVTGVVLVVLALTFWANVAGELRYMRDEGERLAARNRRGRLNQIEDFPPVRNARVRNPRDKP